MLQPQQHVKRLIGCVFVLCLCGALIGAWSSMYLPKDGSAIVHKATKLNIHCLTAVEAEQATAQLPELAVVRVDQRLDPTIKHTIVDFSALSGSGRNALLHAEFHVPKVIHQVWTGNNTAQKAINTWSADYCKRCAGWSHRLWTPAELQSLVAGSQHNQSNMLSSSTWQAEASALYEHGGVVIPVQLQWDGRQCLDSLLLLARSTGAMVTVLNGTAAAHSVVAAIKHHPFIRQWASTQVALAGMGIGNFRNATLYAALQTVDNNMHSPHCDEGFVAAPYFSAWEPALTTSLASMAYVPSGVLFVPYQSGLQQDRKTVSAVDRAACVSSSSSNSSSFANITCCDMASTRAHIVISHCREGLEVFQEYLTRLLSLPAISQFQPCLFVYSKCGQAQQVRQVLPTTVQVVALEEIGREGHTYLTHITAHYDSLPGHMVFLQGRVEGPAREFDVMLEQLATLDPTSGFLSLGLWKRAPLHLNEVPYYRSAWVRLTELYSWVHKDLVPEVVDLTYRGRFAVAKGRVLAHPKSFYTKLLEYLTAPLTQYIAKDYRYMPLPAPSADKQRKDPLFGHVLERSWGFIFGCGPMREKPRAKDGLTCA